MSDKAQPVELPPITLFADGPTEEIREANMEAVTPSPGFPDCCFLLVEAIVKRADIILMDYTRDQVTVRFQIDGVWHDLPPRDRASGDLMLATLKKLANLDFQERRNRQKGEFGAEWMTKTHRFEITSQGVRTGERVVLRTDRPKKKLEKLEDLGIRPKLLAAFQEQSEASEGLILFSSLPGDGKSTLWRCGLNSVDRFTRDYYSIESQDALEPEIINVAQITFNPDIDETPLDKLPQLLLRQPDVMCLPDLVSGEVVNEVCTTIRDQQKQFYGYIPSRSALEAILRVLSLKPDPAEFAESLSAVLHERIVRKLCDNCRQPYDPSPQMLAKLGIPTGRVQSFFDEWRPPPPEEQVDEKGNPIEIPVCPKCNGIGYYGRTGIFELLVITEEIREVIRKKPSLDALTAAAAKGGHISLKDEGIVLVAKGTTSIQELQRVLKK